jgi:glycosyltransferase involved in cell wall biosynthesis
VEEDIWRSVDLILYPTAEETHHVREYLAGQEMQTCAETVPLFAFEGELPSIDASEQALDARHHLLFVGGYSHAPNEDAVVWFAREVWPKLKGQREGMRLVLVGAEPSAAIQALSAPDIEITGHALEHELAEHYSKARVAIAPLRFGAGLKGKVIEAMHRGVPCVTTSIGAQGLQGADFLRVADSPQRMGEEILALFDDDAWLAASQAGQEFVAEHFSVTSVWNALRVVMDPSPYRDVAERRARISAASSLGDRA